MNEGARRGVRILDDEARRRKGSYDQRGLVEENEDVLLRINTRHVILLCAIMTITIIVINKPELERSRQTMADRRHIRGDRCEMTGQSLSWPSPPHSDAFYFSARVFNPNIVFAPLYVSTYV